jgi:hypothetical protein
MQLNSILNLINFVYYVSMFIKQILFMKLHFNSMIHQQYVLIDYGFMHIMIKKLSRFNHFQNCDNFILKRKINIVYFISSALFFSVYIFLFCHCIELVSEHILNAEKNKANMYPVFAIVNKDFIYCISEILFK